MRLLWILSAGIASLPACALAQDQQQDQQYDTPLYTTQAPEKLDPNYGLPSFGMPGSELPKQKTMASPRSAQGDPGEPDFFTGAPTFKLPKTKTAGAGDSGTDTPLFTTGDGSTGDSGMSDSGMSDSTTSGGGTSDGAMASDGTASQ